MIGILLLTHEDFGAAMLKSANLIVGHFEQTLAIGLNRGDDITAFADCVKDAIQKLDTGEGVLVFVDLFGASPYNATAIASQNIENEFYCVTGLSFPMLLEALTMRATYDLETLMQNCMEIGLSGIKELFFEMGKL